MNRIVALEEHISLPELTGRIPEAAKTARGWPADDSPASFEKRVGPALRESINHRIHKMDEAGVTVQVLSVAGAGADLLTGQDGHALARDYNDALAQYITAHPDRFAAFAHLPMTDPDAAALELERTVQQLHFRGAMINGLTQERFLDHPRFEPLLAQAEFLDVPIYLHPGPPPPAVQRAYYDGLSPVVSTMLGLAGYGWHAETAIHVLRLILSGTLDRHPRLQLIIGHMGETLPVVMARCDNIFKPELTQLSRTVSQTLRDQVYITTSGVFTQPPLMAAIATLGIDRVLFSVDYPFSTNTLGRAFLDSISLSPADMAKIAHGNADRLLKLTP